MPVDSLLFARGLEVWDDTEHRTAAANMAVDEYLLRSGDLRAPLLRHYRWSGRCATFGYTQEHGQVRSEMPNHELMRRWTGGGIVDHLNDWTFSLVIPKTDAAAQIAPKQLYPAIHRAAAKALDVSGHLTQPVKVGLGDGSSCFSSPVPNDLTTADGQKVCGGAQRRTRYGTLHQGSIQSLKLPQEFLWILASQLSTELITSVLPEGWEEAAGEYIEYKYGTREWLEDRKSFLPR